MDGGGGGGGGGGAGAGGGGGGGGGGCGRRCGCSSWMSHALYVLFKAFRLAQLLLTEDSFDTVAKKFIEDRFRASEVTVSQDHFAWYMGSKQASQAMQQRVSNFVTQMCWADPNPDRAWPPKAFYSCTDGLQVFQDHPKSHQHDTRGYTSGASRIASSGKPLFQRTVSGNCGAAAQPPA